MPDGLFVSYLRVSTKSQGASGLGLDAQKHAVAGYLNGGAWKLVGEFTEIESGKRNDRPQLALAFAACRLTGAKVVIAKLDRLSRDAGFLMGLDKAGIEFVAADMPHANRLNIGIMAVVADEERRMIGLRTKAALAMAKARGTVLGGFKGGPVVDYKLGCAAQSRQADEFAARVAPMIAAMRLAELTFKAVAASLNDQSVKTARGRKPWSAVTAQRVLFRAPRG